jgi:hypothetical protein
VWLWVWLWVKPGVCCDKTCDNSYFDAVHWKNGSIIGAPVMRAHEEFMFVKVSLAVGC